MMSSKLCLDHRMQPISEYSSLKFKNKQSNSIKQLLFWRLRLWMNLTPWKLRKENYRRNRPILSWNTILSDAVTIDIDNFDDSYGMDSVGIKTNLISKHFIVRVWHLSSENTPFLQPKRFIWDHWEKIALRGRTLRTTIRIYIITQLRNNLPSFTLHSLGNFKDLNSESTLKAATNARQSSFSKNISNLNWLLSDLKSQKKISSNFRNYPPFDKSLKRRRDINYSPFFQTQCTCSAYGRAKI